MNQLVIAELFRAQPAPKPSVGPGGPPGAPGAPPAAGFVIILLDEGDTDKCLYFLNTCLFIL